MIVVAVGIEMDPEGRVLVARRRAESHLGGYWEWPGGKLEPGESPAEGLKREWLEELGVEVANATPWTFAHHSYKEREVLLLFYRVSSVQQPTPASADFELRWVLPDELATDQYPFPPANELALSQLKSETTA